MTKGKGKKVDKGAKITKAGAVEISEDKLDEASGGAAVDYYLKVEGVDGDITAEAPTGYDLKANKKL